MARTFVTAYKNHIYSLASDGVDVLLITFSHPNLAPDLRLAINGEDIISNGDTYGAASADITLPADVEGKTLQTQIRLTNVSREFTSLVRDLPSTVDLNIKSVLASDPDTVNFEFTDFKLRGTELDAISIVGTFSQDSLDSFQFGWRFTSNNFPNIFQIQR